MKTLLVKTLLVTGDKSIQHSFAAALKPKKSAQLHLCASAESAEKMLKQHRNVDLLAIDFDTSGLGGLKTVERLAGIRPIAHVMLLTQNPSDEIARLALRAGVSSVIPADLSQDLLAHVLALSHGDHKMIMLPKTTTKSTTNPQSLSKRELQILTLLCDGQQNKEIAHAFGIQEVTVKMHMRAVIRKLGARNRTHAAMIARDQGLV